MGRPKGRKNNPKLQLTGEVVDDPSAKKPTRAQIHQALKRKVMVCVHAGMPEAGIAAAIGVDVERLKALYGWELLNGWYVIHAEELMRADAQSAEGKTSATKMVLKAGSGAVKPVDSKADAAKTKRDNIVDLAIKRMNGSSK